MYISEKKKTLNYKNNDNRSYFKYAFAFCNGLGDYSNKK